MITAKNILKEYIREAITASDEYMKKEKVRQDLQDEILYQIKRGEIRDEEELKCFFDDMKSDMTDLAIKSLEMIPFNMWQKLSLK